MGAFRKLLHGLDVDDESRAVVVIIIILISLSKDHKVQITSKSYLVTLRRFLIAG